MSEVYYEKFSQQDDQKYDLLDGNTSNEDDFQERAAHSKTSTLHLSSDDISLRNNKLFQEQMDKINDETLLEQEQAFDSLAQLSRDFVASALTFGQIIIAERFLHVVPRFLTSIFVVILFCIISFSLRITTRAIVATHDRSKCR